MKTVFPFVTMFTILGALVGLGSFYVQTWTSAPCAEAGLVEGGGTRARQAAVTVNRRLAAGSLVGLGMGLALGLTAWQRDRRFETAIRSS